MPTQRSNPWILHVLATKKKYPNKSYKDCLVEAKKTYKSATSKRS